MKLWRSREERESQREEEKGVICVCTRARFVHLILNLILQFDAVLYLPPPRLPEVTRRMWSQKSALSCEAGTDTIYCVSNMHTHTLNYISPSVSAVVMDHWAQSFWIIRLMNTAICCSLQCVCVCLHWGHTNSALKRSAGATGTLCLCWSWRPQHSL